MRRRAIIKILGGGAIAGSYAMISTGRTSSSAEGTSTAKPISSEYFGLNIGTELSWSSWRSQLLPLYQNVGASWLRVWYNWAEIEIQPKQYNGDSVRQALRLAKEQGFRILFVVWGTPAYAGNGDLGSVPQTQALSNYCQWLKTNLGDLVDAWEIGNEPNLPKYYAGSPSSYVSTLATAYQVLHKHKLVVAAAPSGAASPDYWQALLDSGLERHCDRVNLHPYRRQPQQVVRLVDNFLQRVQKPLWITELGLSTDDGGEQAKADFLSEVLPLLTKRVEKLFWYRGIQGSGLHPLRFGLLEANRTSGKVTPLAAYFTYAAFARK